MCVTRARDSLMSVCLGQGQVFVSFVVHLDLAVSQIASASLHWPIAAGRVHINRFGLFLIHHLLLCPFLFIESVQKSIPSY